MRTHSPGYGATIPNREDRAWAAGLFEGEGCFSLFRKDTGRYTYQYPRASVLMTDEQVVRRFCHVVGVGRVNGPYAVRGHPDHKPKWSWTAQGHEVYQHVVVLLWEWLGVRRREKARELLISPVGRVAGEPPLTREAAKRTCSGCGFVTSAGPLAIHQRSCLRKRAMA